MRYCLENAEGLVEELPSKELTVEEAEETQKENVGSLVWMKIAASRAANKAADSELEELKEWNKKFVPGKLRAPLALSQRLNISG